MGESRHRHRVPVPATVQGRTLGILLGESLLLGDCLLGNLHKGQVDGHANDNLESLPHTGAPVKACSEQGIDDGGIVQGTWAMQG